MQGESFLTNIKRVFSAFSIVSLFCNPIIYAQYEQYMLVYQQWVTRWLLWHSPLRKRNLIISVRQIVF